MTITINSDDTVTGVGAGKYAGKIITVAIGNLGLSGAYYSSATDNGEDKLSSYGNCVRGNVIVSGANVFYSGTMFYCYGSKESLNMWSMAGNPVWANTGKTKVFSPFVCAKGILLPFVSSATKVDTYFDTSIFISTSSGILAIYPNNGRNAVELITSEPGCQFSAYIDTSGSGDYHITYSVAAGIMTRNLLSGVTDTIKTCAAGAYLYIVKAYGVVLNGYINLIGCSVAPSGVVHEIKPSLSSASVLAIGTTIDNGVYNVIRNIKMEYVTSVIDPTTAEEVLVFKDPGSGMLYKKQQNGYSIPFFEKEVFTGISAAYTYFPLLASMFNARFAMAGGFALTGSDLVVNGDMKTLTGWNYSGATSDGKKVTLTGTSYIQQTVAEDCIVVAFVSDPTSLECDGAAIIKMGVGNFAVIMSTPTKSVIIRRKANFKGANLVVTAVHAYKIERVDTSVYISDMANYEEFYAGTGSIQKLPALGIKFNGMVAIGDTLYLIRDGSTAKISETGSATNPFAVVEEFVRQGGQFPFKCLQTFAVVRKASSKGEDTADVFLFSGTDYLKLNTVWNTSFDQPFSYAKVERAEMNGMTILSQNNRAIVLGDSGRSLSIETHQEVEKIGELGIGCTISGDINEDVFTTQTEHNTVEICFTAGQPNQRKRLRKVKVLPEQSCQISVEATISSPANGAAAFNYTGRDINVVVDIADDSYIEGMQFEADVIMPTDRR